jgi:hypothetical protein
MADISDRSQGQSMGVRLTDLWRKSCDCQQRVGIGFKALKATAVV